MNMRADLEAIAPERIKRLPIDPERGYPVPWFVSIINGKPEFRVADAKKYAQAVRARLCWTCGEPIGRRATFVVGPMCTINRVSAEPPSHLDCGIFSVRACPFLSRPAMERRKDNLPAEVGGWFGGEGFEHNPTVTALYVTVEYDWRKDGHGGHLFHLGEPLTVSWWTRGRVASPAEALEAFAIGAKRLGDLAGEQGPDARKEFDRLHARALALLPAGAQVEDLAAVEADRPTVRG